MKVKHCGSRLESTKTCTGRRKPVQPHLGGELLRQLWGLRWDIADYRERLYSMQVHGTDIGTSMCMWAKFCSACAGIAHRQLLAQSRQLCLDMRLGPRWSLSWRERRLGERPRCNSYVADAMLLPCGSARRLEVAASWLERPAPRGMRLFGLGVGLALVSVPATLPRALACMMRSSEGWCWCPRRSQPNNLLISYLLQRRLPTASARNSHAHSAYITTASNAVLMCLKAATSHT